MSDQYDTIGGLRDALSAQACEYRKRRLRQIQRVEMQCGCATGDQSFAQLRDQIRRELADVAKHIFR